MRHANGTLALVVVVLLVGAALTSESRVEAGGGWPPVVLATGDGFAEPTVLDTARSASLLQMLNHNGAARVLPAGESIDTGRARIDSMGVPAVPERLPAGDLHVPCGVRPRTDGRFYPAVGDDVAALFVRGGVTFEAGPLLLLVLGELGLPTRIELPANVEAVAPAPEVQAPVLAQRSGYDRAVRAGGGMAIAIGVALVGGALLSVVGVRVPRLRAREARSVLQPVPVSGSPRA